jgi:molecular chaperone HtpG
MKKFKTESRKVLDLMINSIYTHKEIFIRELISNASDAIDKLYYKSLTENISGLDRGDFYIEIAADKTAKTLTIKDNGIGMTEEELDGNLGVIAKSGSRDFKETAAKDEKKDENINIIGQFGVGFYSAFMVARKVEVVSRAYGADKAFMWTSNGSDGYDIVPAERDGNGTTVTLYLRDDTEDDKYSNYLEEYEIKELVKKYSDYIRYPIKTETTQYKEVDGKQESYKATETLNSMVPLWKKNKNEIKKEDYDNFYKENFYDYELPARVIHTSAEGKVDYKALLFIPSHPQYDFYTKNFEKGLRLYRLLQRAAAGLFQFCERAGGQRAYA